MPTVLQIAKNLELSENLIDNPSRESCQNASYIVVTRGDFALNKENLKLASSLKKQGKKVIKATETSDKHNPWNFAFL